MTTSLEQRTEHFNVLLVESIDEAITALLSHQVVEALVVCLAAQSVTKDQIPYQLDTLLSTLEKTFGSSVKTVGKAIAKRFYSKLGLKFVDNSGMTLLDHVEHARNRLVKSAGEQQ